MLEQISLPSNSIVRNEPVGMVDIPTDFSLGRDGFLALPNDVVGVSEMTCPENGHIDFHMSVEIGRLAHPRRCRATMKRQDGHVWVEFAVNWPATYHARATLVLRHFVMAWDRWAVN